MEQIHLPIPTESEQTAIANYLDRKTAEIDELIAKKKNCSHSTKKKNRHYQPGGYGEIEN